jgi:hypothetical protein
LSGAVDTRDGQVEATFLLDDAADVNVISQAFVLQHNLERIEEAELPDVDSFEGQPGYCYGAYAPRIRLTDSEGVYRETSGTFYAFDSKGKSPSVILGRPWRAQQAVVVDSPTDRWRYASKPPQIQIEEPEQFLRSAKQALRVFAIGSYAMDMI